MNRIASPRVALTALGGAALLLAGLVVPATIGPAAAAGASGPAGTFANPVSDVFDPNMVTDGGKYYLVGSSTDNVLRMQWSTSVQDLRSATFHTVWTGPTTGLGSKLLWSPVMTKLSGTWYIHLTVTDNADPRSVTKAALYALESTTAGPEGPYILKGTVKSWQAGDPEPFWETSNVAPSVTQLPDGKLWLSTSTFGFYLQEMANPWTLKAGSSRITVSNGAPTLPWEGGTLEISRPFTKTIGGVTRTYVPYSSENYGQVRGTGGPCWGWCVGMFVNSDGNIGNPASWSKATQPVFSGGPTSGFYRVLALTPFLSPDQTEDWIVYNGSDALGTDFGERDAFLQKFTWNTSTAMPVFGTPVPIGTAQTLPSGDTGTAGATLPGDVLMNDSFSSAAAWSPTGTFTLCGGAYCAGSGDVTSLAGGAAWSDYALTAKVTATAQPANSGINVLARAQGPNDFYALELMKNGAGTEYWVLVRKKGGVYTQLATGPYDWAPGVTYWMRLVVNEEKIAGVISTDGTTWNELGETSTIADVPVGFNLGKVGVRSWGSANATFDDVVVTARKPTYGFYSGEGWHGLTIDAGKNPFDADNATCQNVNDEYCVGGNVLTTTATVTTAGVVDALPASMYQTERWNDAQPATRTDDGSFRYVIPSLTPGEGYDIKLHFAELAYTTLGNRRFDVAINGALVLDEFDTSTAAGAVKKAVVRTFQAKADQFGQITIAFLPGGTAGKDPNPTVSAIQVLPIAQRTDTASAGATGAFYPDPAGSGGDITTTTAAISTAGVPGAAPEGVYKSERYAWGSPGEFSQTVYSLAPGATYVVRLHFAEIHYTGSGGQRAFNVSINGAPVLTNFDKAAAAGGPNRAVVRSFTTTATASGTIVLRFWQGTAPGVDHNPTVSGIEVLSQY